MAGGIQKGMVAADELARTLDKHCSTQAKLIKEKLELKHGGRLVVRRKMPKDQIPNGRGACQPDGWLWYYNDILIATFEAKKQQDAGNAISRWYENMYICRKVSPHISYVTFAAGEGAYPDGAIGKSLSPALDYGFNKYVPGDNSCFMSVGGFSAAEVKAIMLLAINERIASLS